MQLLCVLAACGGGDPVATCEPSDADSWPDFSPKRSAQVPAPIPTDACLTDQRVGIEFPNHVQLTVGAQVQPLTTIDIPAVWDRRSNSVWLQVGMLFDGSGRRPGTSLDQYDLLIELDATALPEGEAQTLQVDLESSGQWSAGWVSWPDAGNRDVPGARHSPAIRTLLLHTWNVKAAIDYHYRASGTIHLTQVAGRLRGSMELALRGPVSIDRAGALIDRVDIVACFDAYLARNDQPLSSLECGLDQIDLGDTPNCGTQGVLREYVRCGESYRTLDSTRVDAVTSCVRDKLASGQPFHARVGTAGSDYEYYVVWVQRADGVLNRYDHYSTTALLTQRRCDQPHIAELDPQRIDELIECGALLGERSVCAFDDRVDSLQLTIDSASLSR